MDNALKMFNEVGFKQLNWNDNFLLYEYATDYEQVVVCFDLQKQTYYTTYSRFVDDGEHAFVPMSERPQNTKHSCFYGHWQAEMWHEIGAGLHKAIHQQLIELGWIA